MWQNLGWLEGAATRGGGREWFVVVDRGHQWLGADLCPVLCAELEVKVGCSAAAGVAAGGDLLAVVDGLSVVDE